MSTEQKHGTLWNLAGGGSRAEQPKAKRPAPVLENLERLLVYYAGLMTLIFGSAMFGGSIARHLREAGTGHAHLTGLVVAAALATLGLVLMVRNRRR